MAHYYVNLDGNLTSDTDISVYRYINRPLSSLGENLSYNATVVSCLSASNDIIGGVSGDYCLYPKGFTDNVSSYIAKDSFTQYAGNYIVRCWQPGEQYETQEFNNYVSYLSCTVTTAYSLIDADFKWANPSSIDVPIEFGNFILYDQKLNLISTPNAENYSEFAFKRNIISTLGLVSDVVLGINDALSRNADLSAIAQLTALESYARNNIDNYISYNPYTTPEYARDWLNSMTHGEAIYGNKRIEDLILPKPSKTTGPYRPGLYYKNSEKTDIAYIKLGTNITSAAMSSVYSQNYITAYIDNTIKNIPMSALYTPMGFKIGEVKIGDLTATSLGMSSYTYYNGNENTRNDLQPPGLSTTDTNIQYVNPKDHPQANDKLGIYVNWIENTYPIPYSPYEDGIAIQQISFEYSPNLGYTDCNQLTSISENNLDIKINMEPLFSTISSISSEWNAPNSITISCNYSEASSVQTIQFSRVDESYLYIGTLSDLTGFFNASESVTRKYVVKVDNNYEFAEETLNYLPSGNYTFTLKYENEILKNKHLDIVDIGNITEIKYDVNNILYFTPLTGQVPD